MKKYEFEIMSPVKCVNCGYQFFIDLNRNDICPNCKSKKITLYDILNIMF